MKGVAQQLQAGDQKQIYTGVERPVAGAGQLGGAVIGQYQSQHPDQCDDEDSGLRRVGQDRAAQPATQAVGQCHSGKQQCCADKRRAAAVAVIAADYGGVAPDLVEQANQNGRRERQRCGAAVVAGQKADQAGCLKASAQAVDHQPAERDRQPVGGVGQATDQAELGAEVGGIGD